MNPLSTSLSETTNTFRRIYLNSEHAHISYSPFHKMWTLPPLLTDSKTRFRISVEKVSLFHTFPSCPDYRYITYVTSDYPFATNTIVIPPGDWNAISFAEELTNAMADDVKITVTFDMATLKFTFDPALPLYATNAASLLGITESTIYGTYSESEVPVNFVSVTDINVVSNWTVNNMPVSNQMCNFPVNADFSEMISYWNPYSIPELVLDHDIRHVELYLTDHNNVLLSEYCEKNTSYPPWSVTLCVQPISTPQ